MSGALLASLVGTCELRYCLLHLKVHMPSPGAKARQAALRCFHSFPAHTVGECQVCSRGLRMLEPCRAGAVSPPQAPCGHEGRVLLVDQVKNDNG